MEKTIYKNYTKKIKNKNAYGLKIDDLYINGYISLLNYCFQKKNNFFVKNFNMRVIQNVYLSYNQIKTNILTPTIHNIFESVNYFDIKLHRFIVSNYITNFDNISDNIETKQLCENVPKELMKNFQQLLTEIIKILDPK